MNYIRLLCGFGCLFTTILCYILNRKRRADWIMDIIGIIGILALLAVPFFMGTSGL